MGINSPGDNSFCNSSPCWYNYVRKFFGVIGTYTPNRNIGDRYVCRNRITSDKSFLCTLLCMLIFALTKTNTSNRRDSIGGIGTNT